MSSSQLNIGLNIKKLRELKNLTQEYLAKELDVSQKTICNIEQAENDIKISTALKICKILGVSLTQLIQFNLDVILTEQNK